PPMENSPGRAVYVQNVGRAKANRLHNDFPVVWCTRFGFDHILADREEWGLKSTDEKNLRCLLEGLCGRCRHREYLRDRLSSYHVESNATRSPARPKHLRLGAEGVRPDVCGVGQLGSSD